MRVPSRGFYYYVSQEDVYGQRDMQIWEIKENVLIHIDIHIGYSAGEFQALQLIVLATFGVVD